MMRGILAGLFACLLTAPVAAQAPFAAFDRASEPILNDPHDLAIGPDGLLHVADKFANRITVLDPTTLAFVSSYGDGALPGVHDISFGPDGRAYVAVTGLSAVAVFVQTVTGWQPQELWQGFARTEGVLAHSSGAVFVMASGTGRLIRVENGAVTGVAAEFMPGAHDVAEAGDGTIWVADNVGRRLVQFDTGLTRLRVLSGPPYGFVGARYLDIDEFGRLVVADQDAHRVLLIEPTGDLVGVIGTGEPGNGPGLFDDPEGALAVGNTFWFSDSDNNRIVRYVVVTN